MNQKRGNFGSMLGVVLATAGSAVGLGNVWRFPYMTGQNGGAAFILIYIACILVLGIPGMISEFVVGRHSQTNAYRAYDRISGGKAWRFIGLLGVLTSMIILGFYAVVAGWCLQYLVSQYFQTFSSDPLKPCLWAVAFILLTHIVIIRGVRKGIERASKLLMPILFFLLLVIVVSSCMLPGAVKGIEFLFKPDFSKVTHSVMLEALGQAFFSLSLGTACLCTYASYFDKKINLFRSAGQIAILDSIIAILAGLMIFPAAFSVGIQPDSGPSLIFITLPNVFQQAFAFMPILGYVVSVLFYALLVFAALTSTISMHEIGTVFFHEELHITRHQAAWILTGCCSVLAVFCSLSVGANTDIRVLGLSLMDFCDQLTAQVMLPIGAFLTSIMIGWFVARQLVRDEFTNGGTVNGWLFRYWLFALRWIVPLCILLVFLHQLGVV